MCNICQHLFPKNKIILKLGNRDGIPDIKVITGIRRCGKSKIMDALTELIKESDPSGNVIHVNYNRGIFGLFSVGKSE